MFFDLAAGSALREMAEMGVSVNVTMFIATLK
jgi:hypothetical protein